MPTFLKNLTEYKGFVSKKGLVVVDFYADWCGPCKFIAPIFEEWSKKYTDVAFGKVNVDEADDIASEEAIEAMPTFIFYKDGQVIKKIQGADQSQILSILEKKGV